MVGTSVARQQWQTRRPCSEHWRTLPSRCSFSSTVSSSDTCAHNASQLGRTPSGKPPATNAVDHLSIHGMACCSARGGGLTSNWSSRRFSRCSSRSMRKYMSFILHRRARGLLKPAPAPGRPRRRWCSEEEAAAVGRNGVGELIYVDPLGLSPCARQEKGGDRGRRHAAAVPREPRAEGLPCRRFRGRQGGREERDRRRGWEGGNGGEGRGDASAPRHGSRARNGNGWPMQRMTGLNSPAVDATRAAATLRRGGARSGAAAAYRGAENLCP